MRNVRTILAGSFLLAAGLVWAGDAKLVEDKVLDIAGTAGGSPAPTVAAACLSPDGKHLLYARGEKADAKPERYTGRWSGRLYRLYLRDLATGKDVAIPAPAWTWDDPLRLMLSQDIFSDDGKRIVLGVGTTDTEGGIFNDREGTMKPAIYDIASGKLQALPVEGKIVLPWFHRNGKDLLMVVAAKNDPPKELIVTPADKYEPRKVPIGGTAFDMCPTADVVPVMMFPQRGADGKRPLMKLKLFDLSAGKILADLTIHKQNDDLNKYYPRWTPDGRFLYYYDIVDDSAAGEGRPPGFKTLARIWDRQEGKEAGIVDGAIPLGSGRKDGEMVLRSKEMKPRLILHDAATGKATDLLAPDTRIMPLCASGGRILYAKTTGEGKVGYHLVKIK